ncbi:MAG: SH3 domain-containing protein [Chloroflexota bacterium]
MRWWGLIAILLCGIVVGAQSEEQAQTAYETGNYSAAIGLYEAILAENDTDARLLYNLGNAYYANQQYGYALLNYLRAERLAPRDSALASQISRVQAERVDGMLVERDWGVITARLSSEYLTLTETSLIVLAVWVVFCVMLGLRVRRDGWGISLIVGGIVLLIGIGILATRVYVENQRPQAVVINDEARAMSGPGFRYLPLFTVYDGLDVRVVEQRGNWVRVRLADGRQGWIEAFEIESVE